MKSKVSISHFSGMEQQVLSTLVHAVKKQVEPHLIYLIALHSRQQTVRSCFSRGGKDTLRHFEASLLLITHEDKALTDEHKRQIRDGLPEYVSLELFHYPMETYKRHLKQYSLFCCWIQARGILLHATGNVLSHLPEPVPGIKKYEDQVRTFLGQKIPEDRMHEEQLNPIPEQVKKYGSPLSEVLKIAIRRARIPRPDAVRT
ncbi:MAG: hypothetical protein KL787_04045 [Taibaiella sp.]|nr:hypothetical protein [Taibaiella sp.]